MTERTILEGRQLSILAGRGKLSAVEQLFLSLSEGAVFDTYAGVPNSNVTPKARGSWCLDTSGHVWYRAKGPLNTDWVAIGTHGLTAAELAYLDGITAGTGLASKALILDASGNVSMPATGMFGLSRAVLAAAGSGAGDAAVIATQCVAVTGATGATGVALPAAATTEGPIFVINTVATANLLVYPLSGGDDNINALSEDAAISIAPGELAIFIPTDATQWYTSGSQTLLPSHPLVSLAATGANQGNAAVITTEFVAVTAADGATGVALPAAANASAIYVINTVETSPLLVYPFSTGNDAINALSGNAAFSLAPGEGAWFIATSATQWYAHGAAAELFGNAGTLAADGSGAGDAGEIVTQFVAVTAADGTKGVVLPAAATQKAIYVINTVTTAELFVYPVSGGNDNINALSEDAAVSIAPGEGAWFFPTSAVQWYAPNTATLLPPHPVIALAATGTNQSTAAVITTEFVAVTAADGATGVTLPEAVKNLAIKVINTVETSPLLVYPVNSGNDAINGLGANIAFSVAPGESAWFVATSATQWYAQGASAESFANAGTLAAAGSTSADATVILTEFVAVTASDDAKGVALPAAATQKAILVINTVATANLLVYPVDGGNDNINGLAEDAAITLAPGQAGLFVATSGAQWYCADSVTLLPPEPVQVLVAAGSDDTNAAVITSKFVLVTAADGTKGVALPAAADNLAIKVVNTVETSPLFVYPVTGGDDNINGIAEDLAFTVSAGESVWFICTSGAQWYAQGASAQNFADAAALAAAGSTSADAAVIITQLAVVTGADGAKGVALPEAALQKAIYVINTDPDDVLYVYPVEGGNDNINSLSEDAAFTMAPQQAAWFVATSATQWYCPRGAEDHSWGVEGGVGITGIAAVHETSVVREGGIIRSSILIDLTGLNSGVHDADIIGDDGEGKAYIGRITAAEHGTIFYARVTCLETPTTGEPDIDLYSAPEDTGVEDTLISDLTQRLCMEAAEDWTSALAPKVFVLYPAADEYLYLVGSGGATSGLYDAGIFHIELFGYPA